MALPGGMPKIGLGIIMSAKDNASQPIGILKKNFKDLHQQIETGSRRAGIAMAALTAGTVGMQTGLSALRGSFQLAQQAGGFEQTMVSVGVVSRASAEEMTQLEQSAIRAGLATQFSPAQAAEGLQSLASQGRNAQQSMSMLLPVLDLATGSLGQLGVAQAAEAVSGVMNTYRMNVDQAANVTDRLLRITQMTNFQARDFEVGLSRAASTGQAYQQSLDDVLIMMGMLRNANIEASVASTAAREAMRRIATDEKAQNELRRIGVQVYDQQTGRMRDHMSIMLEMTERARTMTDQERNMTSTRIFGVRGLLAQVAASGLQTEVMRDGNRVVIQGAEALAHMRGELQGAGGAANDMRQRVLDTFLGQIGLLTGALQTLATQVGLVFGKLLTPVIAIVVKGVTALNAIIMKTPRPIKLIVGAVFLLTAVFLTLGGGITIVAVAIASVITILGSLLTTIGYVAAGIVVAFAPVIAIGSALVGAAILIYQAYKNNLSGIAEFIDGWVGRVRLAFGALSQFFETGEISGTIMRDLQMAGNEGVLGFVETIINGFTRLKQFWDSTVVTLQEGWLRIAPLWADFTDAIQQLMGEVSGLFGEGAGSLITGLNNLSTDNVNQLGASFGEVLVSALRSAVQAMTRFIHFVSEIIRMARIIRPYLEPLITVFSAIGKVIMFVGRIIGWLVTQWLRLARHVLPVLATLIPGIGPILGIGMGVHNVARRQLAQERADRTQERQVEQVSEYGRLLRAREQADRLESGTSRPGVAADTRIDPSIARLADLVEARGRGAPEVVQLSQTLEIDGDRLMDVVQRVREREGSLEGWTIEPSD